MASSFKAQQCFPENSYLCGSFYGSYKSDGGLPAGYNEVPIDPNPQPKVPILSSEFQEKTGDSDAVLCGELIRSLLDYFRTLESVQAASMPFNGSTRELCLDDLDLLPAEDDGSVIDDLPLFSEATDLMSLGISDFILYDHERDVRIAHVHLDVTKLSVEETPRPDHKSDLDVDQSGDLLDSAEDAAEAEEEWDDAIQVFRTDTEEDMALMVENEKANRAEQEKLQKSSEAAKPEARPKKSESPGTANRMRSSSGSLVVSCRRPGSQRWRVARRVESTLVDSQAVESSQPKAATPSVTPGTSVTRRHSDRPAGRFSHDPSDPLDEYVRKWSETSTPSRQSSLGPNYALNLHTSSLTPCFSPTAARESEAQAFINAYGSRFSLSQESMRTSSRHSDAPTTDDDVADSVPQSDVMCGDDDPFNDIPYSKPKSLSVQFDTASILFLEDPGCDEDEGDARPSVEVDGQRARTRGVRHPAPATRTPHTTPRTSHSKKIAAEAGEASPSVASMSGSQAPSSFFRKVMAFFTPSNSLSPGSLPAHKSGPRRLSTPSQDGHRDSVDGRTSVGSCGRGSADPSDIEPHDDGFDV